MVDPFEVEVECRWSSTEAPGAQQVAGFKITRISEPDLRRLQQLLELWIKSKSDLANGVKRKIKGKEFVRDLRSGMADRQLMEKYALSAGQLRSVFSKLVDSGAIDEMELYTRTTLSESTITQALAMSRGAGQELEQRGSLRERARELLPQRLRRRTG